MPSMARASGPTAEATTCTSAPHARSPATLRAATLPPPTTRQRRPSTTRFTGYCGPATGTDGLRGQDECRQARSSSQRNGRAVGAGRLLLVEAEDLQLDGQVDLAQRYVGGHRDDRRREVEDGGDAGRHH